MKLIKSILLNDFALFYNFWHKSRRVLTTKHHSHVLDIREIFKPFDNLLIFDVFKYLEDLFDRINKFIPVSLKLMIFVH